MDLDCLGQGLVVSPVALPRGMASLGTIVFFVHQVVPGPEGHQVSVVGWRRDGHGACAAHIGVTQLVGENLKLVRRETIVIPEDVVVGRPACPLDAGVTTQVEVKLGWVGDLRVHSCACWNVPTLPNPLVLVSAEEPRVVPLLHHNKCNPWLVVLFQLDTGLADGQQLVVKDLLELALGDTVTVEDDAGGLEACGLVELDEQLAHHGGQVLNDLLPVLLHTHSGTVAVGVRIHAAHDCGN